MLVCQSVKDNIVAISAAKAFHSDKMSRWSIGINERIGDLFDPLPLKGCRREWFKVRAAESQGFTMPFKDTFQRSKVLSPVIGTVKDSGSQKDHLEESEALPLLFPMYTVPLFELLKMTKVRPHEELKPEGVLRVFERSMGNAAFVSHQWISVEHPDPEGKQMRVLQEALGNMTREKMTLLPDVSQGMYLQGCRLSTEVLRSKPLFIWYDYFSVPQGKDCFESWTLHDVSTREPQAIESIPAYIDRCELFFVLCPVVPSVDRMELFGSATFASRGWCLAEKLVRQLSPNPLCILGLFKVFFFPFHYW